MYIVLGGTYMNKSLVKKIIYGLLIVLWLGLIFYFSHQTAEKSENVTAGLASEIVETVETGKAASPAEEAHWDKVGEIFTPLRKCAQVFEFFVLGLLIINFVKEFKLSSKEIITSSLIASLFFGVADEFHQSFVVGRAGTLIDVGIDFLSSLVAVVIFMFVMKKLNEKKKVELVVEEPVEEVKSEKKEKVVEKKSTTKKTTKNSTSKNTKKRKA